jgi:UDP-N-acetylmuramate dehydrogenase
MMENGDIVLQAYFTLTVRPKIHIFAVMESYKKARQAKQPLEYPSAGSTFKRPEGHFAGKLIQDAGLAGFSIGVAQVSEKHCGFVINKGGATSADVLELIRHIQKTVLEQFGVQLETEVRLLGEF